MASAALARLVTGGPRGMWRKMAKAYLNKSNVKAATSGVGGVTEAGLHDMLSRRRENRDNAVARKQKWPHQASKPYSNGLIACAAKWRRA